jgi:hypothetical protein
LLINSNNLDEFDDAQEVLTGVVQEYKKAEKGVYVDWGFDDRDPSSYDNNM